MSKRNKRNECFRCKHRRSIPGDAHIQCVNPDATMKGNKHGIQSGWFMYPINFDPVWKEQDCKNFQEVLEK